MSMIDNLIIDRTTQDVEYARNQRHKILTEGWSALSADEQNEYLLGLKGTYNASDLNRVTDAMEYLVDRIRSYGYAVEYEKVRVPHINPDLIVNSTMNITIPAGRMNGDVNGDGYVNMTDRELIRQHILSPILDETQLLCADVNGDGKINTADASSISGIVAGAIKMGAYCHDKSGTWSVNPDYLTELSQFYVDIPAEVTEGATFNLIDTTEQTQIFAEVHDGYVTVRATAVPITPLEAEVAVRRVIGEYEWHIEDIPQANEMNKYLQNVQYLRDAMELLPHTPIVPTDMEGLTYREANDIEQILTNIESIINRMIEQFVYSGEVYSGEVI